MNCNCLFWQRRLFNDYPFDYGNTLVNYILQRTIDCCTDVSTPESHKLPDNTVHTTI